MKRVLVVDDDCATLDAIADVLRDAGFETSIANTAHDALRELRRSPPAVLLFDVLMPGAGGKHLLEALSRETSLARISKIAMTAWPGPVELPPGVALLHKPFEWERLARLLRDALRPQVPRLPREPESTTREPAMVL